METDLPPPCKYQLTPEVYQEHLQLWLDWMEVSGKKTRGVPVPIRLDEHETFYRARRIIRGY